MKNRWYISLIRVPFAGFLRPPPPAAHIFPLSRRLQHTSSRFPATRSAHLPAFPPPAAHIFPLFRSYCTNHLEYRFFVVFAESIQQMIHSLQLMLNFRLRLSRKTVFFQHNSSKLLITLNTPGCTLASATAIQHIHIFFHF